MAYYLIITGKDLITKVIKMMMGLPDLIHVYFLLGLKLWEMLMSLSNVHGIINMATLCMHPLGLRRQKALSDLLEGALCSSGAAETV